MKLTEQIREYIKCPQFGDKHYGIWGLLSYRQRFLIKKLCEQCDIYEDAADKFAKENIKLKQQLAEKDKEIEKLHKYLELDWAMTPQRVDGKTWTKIEIIREWEKEIRHQVCDEIRKFITENGLMFYTELSTEENKYHTKQYNNYYEKILMLLDKIEKGE